MELTATPAVASERPDRTRALMRALRPHQWVKNVLVFVPLAAAHGFLRADWWIASALTFAVFCMCASAIYMLNDMCDIEADRLHPRKRTRPFAAGDLTIRFGAIAAAVLLAGGLALAIALLSWQLAALASVYVATATAYSLVLKRKPVIDVFALTGLYVIRILAGGVATGIALSSWLLAFALFFFLSLAFVKRYAELLATKGWIAGRGYGPDDVMWMHAIGTSAGYMAVLVLALYVSAPDVAVLYTRPRVLWYLCPLLLFWLTRLWFRAGRRVIHDDPVVEALQDRISYVAVAVSAAIVFAAI